MVRSKRLPLVGLLGANFVSQTGNEMATLALPWFVLVTTGSAAQTGLVAFFGVVPVIVTSFLGGPLVDRLGYTRTAMLADVLSGITVGSIPLLYAAGLLEFPALLALVFLGALLDGPGATARDALLPDVAELGDVRLERANSASQVLATATGLLGPPLAGVLIALVGTTNVLLLDAASFAVSALVFATVVRSVSRRVVAPGTPAEPQPKVGRLGRYLGELSGGLRFVGRQRLILSMLVVSLVGNFLSSPLFAVVLPVYVREQYGNAAPLGLIFSALSAGFLAGGLAYGAFGRAVSRKRAYLGAYAMHAVAIALLAVLPPLPLLLAVAFAAGLFGAPVNVIAPTVRQERTPPELRGTVFGAIRALLMVAAPLGLLLGGYLVERFGVQPVLVAIAVIQGLTALGIFLNPILEQLNGRWPDVGEGAQEAG